MNMDYNPPTRSPARRKSSRRLPTAILMIGLFLSLAFVLFRTSVTQTEARLTSDSPVVAPIDPLADFDAQPPSGQETLSGVIRSGETLSALLGEYLSSHEIHRLSEKSRAVFPLTGLCVGQPYQICLDEGNFASFLYEINRDEQLLIRRNNEKFEITRVPIAYTVEVEVVGGTINSNLFSAVAQVGESPELAIALADIFAWDIDFILDIREGDSFRAVVEKRYREGEPAGYGQVLAAEFINQGTAYRAVRFKDGERRADYFDPEGKSLRKAFLKAPLEFTRISSGFTMRRFHPITKSWKAHPAIDYAAPTGTPIMSVGDGSIARIGQTKGNGNFIQVRHNNGYETMYLHMSRFAKGMNQGRRVKQGEIIGYVGATGLATGPHLCFRMTKGGEPVNPHKIKPPSAPAVSRENLAAFKAAAAPLLARLDGGETHQAKLASRP